MCDHVRLNLNPISFPEAIAPSAGHYDPVSIPEISVKCMYSICWTNSEQVQEMSQGLSCINTYLGTLDTNHGPRPGPCRAPDRAPPVSGGPLLEMLGIKPELLDWRGMNSYSSAVVGKFHFYSICATTPRLRRQQVWSSTYLRVLGWRLQTVSSQSPCS